MEQLDQTFLSLAAALAGEYSLERELGRGGMGIVYLAREVQLDRLVAIKALPADKAKGDIRDRFLRESRTAAALSHPNIVPIHRVGEASGIPYFVMTFVRGETLGERLRSRGPVSPTFLTRVMHDVALALGYAHGRGVIHRDVKPDNILIEEGSERALVTDFGIARVDTDEQQASDSVMGTAHFMSPEQAIGAVVDGRSDVYSLGVVAYLAASGKLPFGADAAIHRSESAPSVASVANGLPSALVRVIDRCMATDPANRFTTAEQVATAIDASTAPAKVALPIQLRMWASTPIPLLAAYQLISVVFGVLAARELLQHLIHPALGVNFRWMLSLAIAPVVPVVVFQLRKTSRTLEAGYTIGDLRLALRTWVAERKEELRFELSQKEPFWAPIVRWGLVGSAAGMIGVVGWLSLVARPRFEAALRLLESFRTEHGFSQPLAAAPVRAALDQAAHTLNQLGDTAAILGLVTVVTMVGLTAMGVSVEPQFMRTKTVGRLRSWLWNSRVGEWLARQLTPAKRGVPDSTFRPTELALGIAVDDLFAALPTAYRQQVGDLPAVGERLMSEAARLRVEVQRLEGFRLSARPEEMELIDPPLAGAKSQLAQTVTALERMRLELLRLSSGTDDLQPLTTSLDAARRMVDDLVRIRDAEDEIDPGKKRWLALESRTPSPA